MKIEYDPERDLLYIWFRREGVQAAQTITIIPGVHADIDIHGKLIGLEVLDATEILGRQVQFEVTLPTAVGNG